MCATASAFLGDQVREPGIDVIPLEAQVLTDPESARSCTAMPPGIDGLQRDLEVIGKLLS